MIRLLILLLTVTGAAPVWAQMRCGAALVEEGDYKAQVLLKCGEPLFRERYYRGDALTACEVIDQWTYDLGPGQFLRVLTFEEGRLERIEQVSRP